MGAWGKEDKKIPLNLQDKQCLRTLGGGGGVAGSRCESTNRRENKINTEVSL